MKMQLMTLTLDNFKGIDHRQFRFEGKNAVLRGDNAAGKTTVYDALTWLLFGKDSQGRTDFEIKPLLTQGERQGEVKDHAAVTSVEAVLLVCGGTTPGGGATPNGTERRLKRCYHEVWSKKRGSSEASFDGHASEYYIDDVPVKKGEFAARVGEIISEDRFRLLTSITWFAGALPWQKRREVLFDLAAVGDDREIMATDRRFEALARAMGDYSLEDFKKLLVAKRRSLNGTRTDIPARLDELSRTAEELAGTDFAAAERQREEKTAARDALRDRIEASCHDGETERLEGELSQVRGELEKLEAANAAWRESQCRFRADKGQEESGIRQAITNLEAAGKRRQRELTYLRERAEDLSFEIAGCRRQWEQIDAERFHGELCPTCGQKLPPDQLEAAVERFERDKAGRKDRAMEAARRAGDRRRAALEDTERMEREEAGDAGKLAELKARLEELSAAGEADMAGLPNYEGDKASLTRQAEDLRGRLESRANAAALHRRDLQNEVRRAEAELDELGRELARRDTLERVRARMEQLRAQAAAAAEELEELDRLLDLMGAFTRYKVQFVEESINRRFELVRFRLFREQINGGIEDCCDVTVNGVPYDGGLNNGARINAGVDIINALSRHYNAYVPLFVDNAESVTRLERAGTQVIRLVVSQGELRCEPEGGGPEMRCCDE